MKSIYFVANLFAQTAANESVASGEATQKFESAIGELLQRTQDAYADPSQLPEFLEFVAVTYLGPIFINLLLAGAIFIVGRWIANAVTRFLGKIASKAKLDETLVKFLENIIYAILMVIVIMASLDRIGVPTTSFAAILAAAGFAIGFALQGSLGNFAAGVMLIVFKPFKAGDFVEAGGQAGVIEEVQIFNTMMRTGDNIKIIVPNSSITGGTIRNFSAKPTRRIDLVVGCGYDDNLKEVKDFLLSVLRADHRVLTDPEPVVAVNELGDSSVNFVVRPWVASPDYWSTRWDLTEAIKLGFDERGFSIPYPQRDVHISKEVA
ncbi:MAG: mechanosensitive ion channel [Planctomycetales bacterium]|nr:mechanosensitive ion channel [Planctomycetales bacterium]